MNILFIVPYVPNPIRVRSYELLRTLAKRGHHITLATLYQSAEEQAALATVAAMGIEVIARALPKHRSMWNSALALPTRAPLQAHYCWQPTLAQALQQVVQERSFDIAHVEHLRGARYGLLLRGMVNASHHQNGTPRHLKLPIVWDSVDCISHLFAQAAERSRSLSGRLMTTFELPRTRRYEGWLLSQFDRVLVTSTTDQQALLSLADQNQVLPTESSGIQPLASPIVLPNGVTLEQREHNSQNRPNTISEGVAKNSVPINHCPGGTIVFSGKMSYHANVSAAVHLIQDIMPLVWARHPMAKVQIVGKDPPGQIRALARQASSNTSTSHQVEVTGMVPDIRPYLRQATVAVAPLLYGAGIQNKVLEAMACGTPVVTTGQAAKGIPAHIGTDLLVANEATGFAEAIIRLLENPELRAQIGDAGRAYVEREHSWHSIVKRLETVYDEARHSD